MRRSLILAFLLAGYATVLLRIGSRSSDRFDPLDRSGRQVEQAIETRRFTDALSLALTLGRAYPDEPVVAYWLAETYQGLGRSREEADAWRAYARVSSTPEESCPALPESLSRMGDDRASLDEFNRCASYEPENPERLMDLAGAYARQGRIRDALDIYARVTAIDPSDPRVADRVKALTGPVDGEQP